MDLIVKKQLLYFQLSLIKKNQNPLTELLIRRIFDYLLVLQCSFVKSIRTWSTWSHIFMSSELTETYFQWETHKDLMKIAKGYDRETFRVCTLDDNDEIVIIDYPPTKDEDGSINISISWQAREKMWNKIYAFEDKKKELEKNYIFKD